VIAAQRADEAARELPADGGLEPSPGAGAPWAVAEQEAVDEEKVGPARAVRACREHVPCLSAAALGRTHPPCE
jgi:hypothetical protein